MLPPPTGQLRTAAVLQAKVVPPLSPEVVADAVLGAVGTRGESFAPYGDGNSAGAIVEALRARLR